MVDEPKNRDGPFRNEDFTSPPGRLLVSPEREAVIERFLKAFREPRLDKDASNSTPTCMFFNDGWIVDESVLLSPELIGAELYFHLEWDWLVIARTEDIANFFEDRNPWESDEYYIFDESMLWCITMEHNDVMLMVRNDGEPGPHDPGAGPVHRPGNPGRRQ